MRTRKEIEEELGVVAFATNIPIKSII